MTKFNQNAAKSSRARFGAAGQSRDRQEAVSRSGSLHSRGFTPFSVAAGPRMGGTTSMPHTVANQPAADQKIEETEVPQSQSSVASQSAAEQHAGYDRTEPKMGADCSVGSRHHRVADRRYFGRPSVFRWGDPKPDLYASRAAPRGRLAGNPGKRNARLHSYQWVDAEAGVVRLPIDRGMELLAAEFAAGKLSYSTEPVLVKKPDLEPRP